jgi:hypothetical protein
MVEELTWLNMGEVLIPSPEHHIHESGHVDRKVFEPEGSWALRTGFTCKEKRTMVG